MGPYQAAEDERPDTPFYIVGIGASAGGLNSFECFLAALPQEFGFAIVFIQHLSPKHTSLMPGILRSSRPNLNIYELSNWLEYCLEVSEVPGILIRIKKGEHIEDFESVRMRKDGTIIPVSLTFSPIKDSSGRIIGSSKIAHDITEQKRAEEALRRSNEELTRFNRAAVGRELRMIELKKEVNELRARAGEPPSYQTDFEEEQP